MASKRVPPAAERPASPRYVQISAELRRRIETGLYPLDAAIPTEAELCAEFAASRFTVREALRLLVESGMVGRRRGSGSFVTARSGGFVQSMRSLNELFAYALDTVYALDAQETVALDEAAADAIGADAGSRWLRLRGVRRTREGQPICFTEVHVDARFAPLLGDVAALSGPIYAAVEARGGEPVMEAVQEFRAAALPGALAARLGAPPGAPALVVTRRYLAGDGATMVCSVNWHPADRFRYAMRLQREAAQG